MVIMCIDDETFRLRHLLVYRFHTAELAKGAAQQSTCPSQVAVRQLIGSQTSLDPPYKQNVVGINEWEPTSVC